MHHLISRSVVVFLHGLTILGGLPIKINSFEAFFDVFSPNSKLDFLSGFVLLQLVILLHSNGSLKVLRVLIFVKTIAGVVPLQFTIG